MAVHINLTDVSIWGVDMHARAATLRQWLIKRKSLKSVRIPILQDVTFSAKPGDRVAVLGINGSGKSSLLKVISGNYPVHAGSRVVEGNITPLIEMGAGFDMEMTGRRNIRLSYAYRGRLHEYSPEVEARIIEFTELGDKIDLPLKTYSSGMSARLAFASSVMQSPDILLLDEIFAAGDSGFVQKSGALLKKKMDEVPITIMVNHNLKEMTALCNRFILMHEGRILEDGGIEVVHHYHHSIHRPLEAAGKPVPSMMAGAVA